MRKTIFHRLALKAISILFVLLLVIFSVAMKKQVDDSTTMDKTYTYLALGDSYTIGEQVESRENFPNQLSTLLRQRGLKFNSPEIVAKTGWTTDEHARRAFAAGFNRYLLKPLSVEALREALALAPTRPITH